MITVRIELTFSDYAWHQREQLSLEAKALAAKHIPSIGCQVWANGSHVLTPITLGRPQEGQERVLNDALQPEEQAALRAAATIQNELDQFAEREAIGASVDVFVFRSR